MKHKLALLIVFLSIFTISKAQVATAFYFFKGDTLQGFDMASALSQVNQQALTHHLSQREIKISLFRKQKAFVAAKYAIVHNPLATANKTGNISVLTSTCNNVDFEDGNFTGWVGAVGYNNNTLLPMTIASSGISTLGLNSPETSCSYHTLVNAAAGMDPYSNLPMIDPNGGSYAVRLGGENLNIESSFYGTGSCSTGDTSSLGGGGSGGETLQQTFLITPSNNLFTYAYSVVMDQVQHGNGEQPYFRIEVLDSTGGQTKICDQYYVQEDSTGAAPKGFITSPVLQGGYDSVYYLPWTSNSINLSPYMGKKITVRFTAAGCTLGGHFAYAYVDCACSPLHLNLSATTACAGLTTSISAPPGAPGYQWIKIPAGPGIVGSSTGAVCQINQSGKYEVTVSHGACSYTIDTTIIFLPAPVYSSAVTNIPCYGQASGSAAITATGGVSPFSYSWSTVPPQTTASVNNLIAGTYSVTIKSINGCSKDTVLTITQPTALTLQPLSPVTICQTQSISLVSVATGGVLPYTYSWTGPGGTAVASPVSPANSTIYTAHVVDANGCQAQSKQLAISVNPPLQVQASGSATLCPGTSTSLSSNTTGGNNAYVYSWSPSAGLSSAASQNPLATPSVTTTYTLTVTDGCGSPADSATVKVTVISKLPIPVFSVSDSVGCAPLCVTFTGSSTPPCISAAWDFGDGKATGCGIVNHCYNKSGTYDVSLTVTDSNGCKGSVLKPQLILVNPIPVAAFSSAPHPVTILDPTVQFTDLSKGADLWSWQFDDQSTSVSSLQNPKFTYPDTGCYLVTLAVQNTFACKDTVKTHVCVKNQFTFYAANAFTPNGDGLNDTWSPTGQDIDPAAYELLIFNRWGDVVFSTTTFGKGWDGTSISSANAQEDTYAWKVTLKDLQGLRYTYTGNLHLIR
jgi:gliding motility-associated-like protein